MLVSFGSASIYSMHEIVGAFSFRLAAEGGGFVVILRRCTVAAPALALVIAVVFCN